MSNTKSTLALEKYTKAKDALDSHILQNKGVFDTHQRYIFALMDAENELRDEVSIEKVNIENKAHKVTITPQTQTFADIEEVDKLVASGLLSQLDRAAIVKTVERPARISITAKN